MKEKKKSFPIFHVLILLLVAAGLAYIYFNPPKFRQPKAPEERQTFEIFSGVSYEAIEKDKYEVSVFASNIPSISSIIMSPDDKYMLASSLDGNITAFVRQRENLTRQALPFFKLSDGAPGFPEEFGLTGITFGADFENNKDVFLFYSERDAENKIFNKVGRVELTETNGIITGTDFKTIFTANVEGNVSHQIQKGIGVMIADNPHVMFSIGEGFNAEQALDKTLESGKIILIQANGSDPLGPRPYPEFPKIQAIGIRNAPGITTDMFDQSQRTIILDTGPEKYDRFIYSDLLNTEASSIREISFNWDGTEASLQKALPDPNIDGVSDMVVHRWDPTITATNVEVHKGKGAIPVSNSTATSLLLSYFGITADPENTRGKQIVLGILKKETSRPSLSLTPIIQRSKDAENLFGNPLGLAVEGSGDFYFGDIIEGRIYKVEVK